MIASCPVGGVVWDYAQYLLGLARLGFEVYYLEDTGVDAWDEKGRSYSAEAGGSVRFLAAAMSEVAPDLVDRWHLRTPDGRRYGMSPAKFESVLADADLFLNVSGSALVRDEYLQCRRTALIDTDPGWNHFLNYPAWDANPGWDGSHGYRSHQFHFTYAECMGTENCRLPDLGITWRPTRPPVILDRWHPLPPGDRWTTLMTWKTYAHAPPLIDSHGNEYGSKEREFPLIEPVPGLVPDAEFEVVVSDTAPVERWRERGWHWRHPVAASGNGPTYRRYVSGSRGELSAAKNVYVKTRSGWFSTRSSCYLAAGRPVVLQDTGFSSVLPSGAGLHAFTNTEEAAAAVRRVETRYDSEASAARELAEAYLGSDNVLGELLGSVGL